MKPAAFIPPTDVQSEATGIGGWGRTGLQPDLATV
jgi:hypothetical protein